jgi:hypothetical protein
VVLTGGDGHRNKIRKPGSSKTRRDVDKEFLLASYRRGNARA